MTIAKPRPAKEYHASAALNAFHDEKQRDILVALQGHPDGEEYDLVVRMPVGIVPAMVTLLHKATTELDKSADSTSAEAQMLMISNSAAADPIGDQCALLLTLENFALPTLLSRKVAVKLIVELEKAVAGLDRGARKPKKKP
jgi:hypothetical protein